MNDFNLSDHVMTDCLDTDFDKPHFKIIEVDEVKKFINKIKERIGYRFSGGHSVVLDKCSEEIDKLAGSQFAVSLEGGKQ